MEEPITKLESVDQVTIETEFQEFKRAVESEDFIYFVDYEEGDENAQTYMFRKTDLELVSNNYFATQDMWEVLENKEFTWMAEEMVYNYNEYLKENNQDHE